MFVLATAAAFLALVALLAAASVTDIRVRKIPNGLVVAVAAVWLLWRCVLIAIAGPHQALALVEDAFGALLFGAALLAFVLASERMAGKRMMGGGDIKLLTALSLFLGIRGIMVALLAACVVSLAYAATRSKRGIPFAPCILCGTFVAVLCVTM